MWLANQTRSDIANAVRAVARNTNLPREIHRKTAVGVLECVFFTSDFCFTCQRGSGLELVAYADADYASKVIDRLSVSGGCHVGRGHPCIINLWFSQLAP